MATKLEAPNHLHIQNRLAVIPTPTRLNADPEFTGKGVRMAFIDSGFYPHADLVRPINRILAFEDITQPGASLNTSGRPQKWDWHGTQTSVVAAGNGFLSDGTYRGLACNAEVVLVKVGAQGRITEPDITRGLEWVIANKERHQIRVVNISLGGDEEVSYERDVVDRAAERAVSEGLVVVVASGNAGCTERYRPIPPANARSVITVGGYDDKNQKDSRKFDLYCSSFGPTVDGLIKPEIIAPAVWVAAPILPATPDYLAHYQRVDGTSFAAPIVSSVVAQMLEANQSLSPAAIKHILISTADRIIGAPLMRQGYGTLNARRAVEQAKREQHSSDVCYLCPPRIDANKLVFIYHNDTAERVSLAGDFNDWNPERSFFTKDPQGIWRTEIDPPPPGHYRYKFVVDRWRWLDDPGNGLKEDDHYGGFNSVLNLA